MTGENGLLIEVDYLSCLLLYLIQVKWRRILRMIIAQFNSSVLSFFLVFFQVQQTSCIPFIVELFSCQDFVMCECFFSRNEHIYYINIFKYHRIVQWYCSSVLDFFVNHLFSSQKIASICYVLREIYRPVEL